MHKIEGVVEMGSVSIIDLLAISQKIEMSGRSLSSFQVYQTYGFIYELFNQTIFTEIETHFDIPTDESVLFEESMFFEYK